MADLSAADRWRPGTPPRFCPHCTHPLEERPAFGRTRPVCPRCGYIHFRDLKVGVSILVEEGGQVLLVRRGIDPGRGQWSLPSGFCEWDEAPEQAAAREVAEETGLAVRVVDLAAVYHYTDDFRGPGINLIYRATVVGGALRAADDVEAAVFLSPVDLPPAEQVAFENHRLALAEWRARMSSSR